MSKINLGSVRLSFPSLFETSKFQGGDTGKYEATFILDKNEHKDAVAKIKARIAELIKDDLKGAKLGADKICLKDGDEQDREEVQGCYTIKVSTKKRPLVINRDRSPITQEDNIIYAGCYVNAIISLWAQNNGWGKRINATLEGVQFVRDGEAFGDAGVRADAFDAFGDHEEF